MKIEDQVCSLELAKKLKELGVGQESLFHWEDCPNPKKYGHSEWEIKNEWDTHFVNSGWGPAAFTVAELGEMLPYQIGEVDKDDEGWMQCWKDENGLWAYQIIMVGIALKHIVRDKNEADARAKMLIHLIENKLITL